MKSWAATERLSHEAKVFWPVTANMPARFDELFTNDVAVEAVPEGAQTYLSWRLATVADDAAHLPEGFAVVGAGAHPVARALGALWWRLRGRPDDRYRYMLFPKQHSRRSTRRDARHIDLEYGRIPRAIRDIYVPIFARMHVRPEIVDAVDQWWRECGGADLVGVQVGTWRDHDRRFRKYHLPARPRLLSLMRAKPPGTRFLVVSDSDDFIDFLAAEFDRERLLAYPRVTARLQSWTSTQGIVEDLIDMLLLARCRTIFASYLSTFSETAWWLGGASADISVF